MYNEWTSEKGKEKQKKQSEHWTLDFKKMVLASS